MRFTIIIASYNRQELLSQTVDSAINQEFDNYEIVIVDDGSEEETKTYLSNLKVERISVFFQSNRGVASARQKGLEQANGDFVVILDSDDELDPNALKVISAYIDELPDTDVFYCNNIEIKPNSNDKIYRSKYPVYSDNTSFTNSIFLKPRVPFKHSGMTYRKSMALNLGGYDIDLPNKIDIDLMLKFLNSGKKVRLIPEYLVVFKMHAKSISSNRIQGISTWVRLVSRYNNKNKVFLIIARTSIELIKFVYTKAFIR